MYVYFKKPETPHNWYLVFFVALFGTQIEVRTRELQYTLMVGSIDFRLILSQDIKTK